MIKKGYNGWDATIRNIRGSLFYALVRQGKLPKAVKCELCGGTTGMTYHAEEYGSTWADYLLSCHPLCGYCHGMIHVRISYPNRWRRFKYRVATGEFPEIKFKNLNSAFLAFKSVGDIDHYPEPEPIDHWVFKLSLGSYTGIQKLALAPHVDDSEVLVPDFDVYPKTLSTLSGVRYDAPTGLLHSYLWTRHNHQF